MAAAEGALKRADAVDTAPTRWSAPQAYGVEAVRDMGDMPPEVQRAKRLPIAAFSLLRGYEFQNRPVHGSIHG